MLIHNPFLKIIADTCTPLSPDKSHFEVLLEGLEGFLQFPDCKEASLFLLDNATFDFYLKLVVPWRDEISLKTEFDTLADSGIIGDVLTTGKIQPARTSKEEGGFHSLVVPLIASSVYGLVVIRMTKIPPVGDPFFSALQIYAHQYVLRLMVSQQSTAIQNLEENMKQMASVSSSHLTDTDIEVLDFLDKFPIGIFLVRKADGIILSVNTAAAIALGTSKENIVNQRIDEFLFKARLINPGDIVTAEESVIRKKNGTLFSIHHNRTEVTLGGEPFWLDIFLDISERKYMEGELQKIREELEKRVEERTAKLQETNEALMNEIAERGKAESELFKFYWAVQQNPVMIILTDSQGTVEYVNPQFCEMTGYKFSEVIGHPIFQLTGVNRDSEQFKKFLSALMRKISWRGQHKTFRKDGEAFWVETIVSPVVNYEGEIKNYVAVQEDITPRKKTEEQMVIAKEKAEEADKLKSSIFANMSHEFRTPLISILGFSRLLSEEVEDSDFRMMSDNIFSAGNRLLRTLNNVLFLAQLDTIQANYTFVKLDINEYIKKVVDSFRQNAEEKQLAIIDELSPEPLFIDSPAEFPEMLVSQLIDNAVKFTKQGHIGVRSHAGHSKNGSKIVIIEVFDTGIGISPDFQNTIFLPFQQASIGYSRTFEGSGLGLSVTMRVLDLLGGTLDVQSKVGEGTRFIISIPAFPEEH